MGFWVVRGQARAVEQTLALALAKAAVLAMAPAMVQVSARRHQSRRHKLTAMQQHPGHPH